MASSADVKMIERFLASDKRVVTDALQNQLIVNGVEKIASRLVEVAELRELQRGEILIGQDGHDNDIHFILSGSLEVRVKSRHVATREAGTHVGEMALVCSKSRRSATVVAHEITVIATVSEADFSSIAQEYPDLWRRIAMQLCDRLRDRNKLVRRRNAVPRVFICSSKEQLGIAEQIQLKLEHHQSTVKVWTDQVFGLTKQAMEDLEREVNEADFAVAIVTKDDVATSRGKRSPIPRDNVVFELGLFMGQLGRVRTIIVTPHGTELKFPSDLVGLNPLTFTPPDDPKNNSEWSTVMGPVCTVLKGHFDQLGPR